MYGFDGETSFKILDQEIGFRFELAYTQRSNSRMSAAPVRHQTELKKDPFFHGVVGVDVTLPGRILDTVMYVNLQYVHYESFGSTEVKPGSLVLIGLPTAQTWDRNLVLFTENRTELAFKINQALLMSLKNWDALWNPKFTYQFSDVVNASVGPQLFIGNKDGFFGQFRDNSRLVFEGSYVF
jgi:hypothetical protein